MSSSKAIICKGSILISCIVTKFTFYLGYLDLVLNDLDL